MREIKCRAWDTTRKVMIQVRQMIIPDGLNEYSKQELSVSGLKYGTNPSNWRMAPPLMQYIGLKDKNGKEIYEEDWLEWDNYYFRVVYDVANGCWYGCPHPGNLLDGELRAGTFAEAEVVGNNFENPGLKEVK